ncbi:MAG TPA: DUF192 domain-containing protein [Candidatus Binatia bacterium]|nr:DUF192 domain-containing protein [Candidatus Binatia bacterium]
MMRVAAFLFCLLPLAWTASCTGSGGPLVTAHGTRGEVPVRVEIARTREQLSRGLMWRNELDADAGMLFVFGDTAPRTFWMKNTPLPLDILFLDDRGTVLNVAASTTPYSEAPIRSAGPARYVLEVNAGFAAKHGIASGARVELPAEAFSTTDK